MALRNGARPAGIVRCTRIAPSRFTMQRDSGRACQSMPQDNGCCWVENRLRSPPLLWYFPYYQHTTVVCGGGASISIKGLHLTASSLRSCLALASGSR
jgi:hypothetical protein